MEDRPRFASRQDYEAWRQSRSTGSHSAAATLDPPGGPAPRATRPGTFRHTPRQTPAKESGRLYEIAAGVVVLAVVAAVAIWWIGYNNASSDPRVRFTAPGKMRSEIRKYVNRSPYWEAYLDHAAPSKKGASPVVSLSIETERRTRKSYGGDYDPGTVEITFAVTQLGSGKTLWEKEARVELEPFMIGRFDKNATREQIQDIAFEATEKKVMPYLDKWVDLAGIRALGSVGRYGTKFVPLLEKTLSDSWTPDDIAGEARASLAAIRGTS